MLCYLYVPLTLGLGKADIGCLQQGQSWYGLLEPVKRQPDRPTHTLAPYRSLCCVC